MRLTELQIVTIRSVILSVDPDADIFLYGSRVDDEARGGDIDLLVQSQSIDFDKKMTISASLFDALDQQRTDLLIVKDDSDPFARLVKKRQLNYERNV